MAKKCIIILRLLDEAEEKSNQELEEEIKEELEENLHLIPWAKEIERITVSEY